MDFGIVHESRLNEKRVALTPGAASVLIRRGHRVYLESGAGEASGFSDQDYLDYGVQLVYSHEEIYRRSDVILKILPLTLESLEYMREGQAVFAFQHMAIAPRELVLQLLERKITVFGLEIIERGDGERPLLAAMGEIVGRMAPIIAGNYLSLYPKSRGVLLGRVPGVAPASVAILGAGHVGINAAQAFVGTGAQVHVLDASIRRLEIVQSKLGNRVTTLPATRVNINKVMQFADVFIAAILKRGQKTPHLITREMISRMKPMSVYIDFSIDEGGVSETSRPTTLADPVYIEENVIHFCVPNVGAGVSRTASRALSNILVGFLSEIADSGVDEAIAHNPALKRGLYTYGGRCMQDVICELFDIKG